MTRNIFGKLLSGLQAKTSKTSILMSSSQTCSQGLSIRWIFTHLTIVFWHFTLIKIGIFALIEMFGFSVFTFYFYLFYFYSPSLLTHWWTYGRHSRPHSHLSARSAPLHLSAPISRWAEHSAATCRPECSMGTSPKSCHCQHFSKPLLLIHLFTVSTVLMSVNHSNGVG